MTTGLRDITITDIGTGPIVLLLHGGGGPTTVSGFAELLAGRGRRVLTPTHPGFAATSSLAGVSGILDLADLYAALLEDRGLSDVIVVGSSIGGWIAAELALRSSRVAGLVLVDAVGLEVPDHPVVDFFSLTPDQVFDLAYHDPERFRVDPTTLPLPVQTAMAANRSALAAYTGGTMSDPTLAGRLGALTVPALVVWGGSDRIVDPAYGKAYAAAIPGARFELIPDAGHLPQLETPDTLGDLLSGFGVS